MVEDPRNGEILAMASNPPFDNRFFVGGISQAKYEELFGETSGNPLVNRAIQGQYQIGSTMKMFTSVAALNSGIIPYANYTIDDKGTYVIPECKDEPSGCEKKNAGGALYGKINLPQALLVSSDVYFYGLGNDMWTRSAEGQNILQDEVRTGSASAQKSGIDLPFEKAGIVPTARGEGRPGAARHHLRSGRATNYFTGDNIQLAIGQGLLSVTPLQLVNGYATFANGGTHFRPLIALRVLAPGTPDGAARRHGRPHPGQRRDARSTPEAHGPREPAAQRRTSPSPRAWSACSAGSPTATRAPASSRSGPTTTTPSRSRARRARPRTPPSSTRRTRRCSSASGR